MKQLEETFPNTKTNGEWKRNKLYKGWETT